MKSKDTLAPDYTRRINDVLDIAWRILKSRFVDGRHLMTKEAPFQHYFAHIISTVGESFCTKRDDLFLVDLETKCDDVKGKTKYLDITCGFPNHKSSCAIELKFKTAAQGAQDHGRIDAFVDIEALELVCKEKFKFGRFYMITNSTPYVNESKKGVGTVFRTHDGAVVDPDTYHYDSVGRKHVYVTLENQYKFEWEKIEPWYFLQLNVNDSN